MLHRRTQRLACALILSHLLAAGATAGPLDPGARLCLYPVSVPLDEKKGEERRSALEQRLVSALQAASFEIADATTVDALEERVRKDVGGVIDISTGTRDPARYRAYRERLAAALREELGCSAQLSAAVVTVRAEFGVGVASWDGATQQVSSTGRIVAGVLGGVYESGWVGALSLWLRAFDLEGNDLAFRSAGIETLVEFALLEDRDLLPEDHWISDSAKLDEAIASALGPGGASLRQLGTPEGVAAARAAKRKMK